MGKERGVVQQVGIISARKKRDEVCRQDFCGEKKEYSLARFLRENKGMRFCKSVKFLWAKKKM